MTSPSQAATSTASAGSMDRPSPTIFCAKTGSGTRSSGQTWPDNGERILSRDINRVRFGYIKSSCAHHAASPPGLGLDAVGQPVRRVLVRRATNQPSEVFAPDRIGDEGADDRAARELSAAGKLRRERDLPQAAFRAERLAFR